MNYTKALRAAHILHKFCNRRKCVGCLFRDTESHQPCRLSTIPKYYQLKDIDKKMYGGKSNDTITGN